jgi:glutamine synthetase
VEPLNAGYQFNLDTYTNSLTEIMDPLSMTLLDLGLPLRTVEHESGPGQVEVTFDPMLALDAADAMLLFRTIIKQTCARRGFHASFMALPGIASFDPSGWHLHQSVLSTTTDRNVFTVDNTEGMSAEGKAYVEGLLALAREFCLLSVPTVNGYWRLRSEFTLSPTRIGWSYEDRTAMVRVLGVGSSTHVENRVGEPCANPYLSIAAQLYAGLDGMTALTGGARPDGLEPVPDTDVHSGEERPADVLPQSLSEALDVFRRSGHARTLLGGPLASCLVKLKESEAARYEAWCDKNQPPAGQVTEWEHREYFEVY